jgi:serine/threonine protein phosphatase PrpC
MEVAHRSDPGRDPDKQINEDACAYAEVPMGHLLVVCDGMGGHMSGREASTRAVHTILHDMSLAQPGSASPCMALKSSIEHAGRVVFDLGGPGQNLLRPGSTCVALLVHTAGVDPAHVGDSRAYLVRGGQITAITRDHSMVRQMVDAGVLSAEDAMRHPDANKITRALGMQPTVEVEVRASPLPIERGDIFLLCSDGLSDLVLPNEMLAVLQHALSAAGLEHACEHLVALANHRGGHDNITVVLGRVVEAPEMRAAPVTVIGAPDPVGMAPPMTMPDLRAIPNLPGGMEGSGLHPTVVDDGTAGTMAHGALASGRVHPSSVPASGPEEEADDDGVRRRRLWIAVGAALVVLGLLLVIASLWWALSAGSSRFDDTGAGTRFACRPTQPGLPLSGESPARRPFVEQMCFPLTLRVDS